MGKSKYITNIVDANNKTPAPFDNIKLKSLEGEMAKLQPFVDIDLYSEKHIFYNGDVPFDCLVGGADYNFKIKQYNERTWSELLQRGMSRSQANLQALEDNPEYYLSSEQRSAWCFSELRGEFYISQGWHRTLISRYFFYYNNLPMILRNCRIQKIAVDESSLEFFNKLKKLILKKYPEMFVFVRHLAVSGTKEYSPVFCISVADHRNELYKKGLKGLVITKANLNLFKEPENNEPTIHPEIGLILEHLLLGKFSENTWIYPFVSARHYAYRDCHTYDIIPNKQSEHSWPDNGHFHHPRKESLQRNFRQKFLCKYGL